MKKIGNGDGKVLLVGDTEHDCEVASQKSELIVFLLPMDIKAKRSCFLAMFLFSIPF
jgi:hypothetical protein